MTKSYVITPAAGKRLIGKAVAAHAAIGEALESGTIVIIAGTTDGYVAEEILRGLGEAGIFDRRRFFRGITLPPGQPTTETGRLADERRFPGDVVIVQGVWQQGKTIADVADALKEGDVVVKGANAVNLAQRRAGILIGDPKGGTIALALQASMGRRVRLLITAGLEKRVDADLDTIAALLNAPGAKGPRFWPVAGEMVTELEALSMLTGARVELVAGGGVHGAEGSVWLAVSGNEEQERSAQMLLASVACEPPFA
ncbi:MAG TPA: hypothetical protein PLO37_03195 [Candidatus Hydrogenedentes bacterium]|nr:hypothetical protein [Candidatus Hydrogenedentota bacterium]HPG65825.1 hypothetical protein [Candidatus Hydrogenedentota bacterium]